MVQIFGVFIKIPHSLLILSRASFTLAYKLSLETLGYLLHRAVTPPYFISLDSHSTSPPISLVLSLSTSPLHFSLASLLHHSFSHVPLPLSLAVTPPSPMPLPSRPYPHSTTCSRRRDNEQLDILCGWTYASNPEDFSEQETQESFESVGTNDILAKSLGNAEHSDRTRGQSKFVKQLHYFNIVQSSRENVEVSEVKLQLAALERTIHFKTSCTQNKNQAVASNLQPMPNASKECQLFINDLIDGRDVLVAIGRAYIGCVPTNIVHGIPLGEENVRVTIIVPKLKRTLLPIPMNEATCIEEVVGEFVAWPKRLVILEINLTQASRGPSHAPDREAEGSK
ncbi:hypothetical protein TIFTF001_028566 [Ficus carica]|uniref:DUF8039 domain-containing protein n=1 Tax=Ficus carica TaxID=3494 RepID=A0AA88DQL6_FICCA|nr:hypothetical protein TIFTF001_028566 [Ficus carica]